MRRHVIRFSLVILMASLCGLPVLQGSGAAERVAALTPDALPEDMRDLHIQEQYVPNAFKQAGVIHSLEGFVVVLHRSTREAFLGTEGDPIHENDEFYTLPDSRCRLRFTNEDVVSLAPETRFSVDEYRSDEQKAEKTSFFSMLKGKAMFYAMRLFRTKKKNFQVKTPTAVMGVRGTKFGAHVYWIDEKQARSRGVQVADSGRGMGPLLAQAGGGGRSVTVVGCGDGSVGVNGTTLGPGQYYNSFTGTVGYDPSVLGGIEGATGGSGGDEGGEGGGDTGGGGGDNGGMVETLTTIIQTQGGEGALGGGEQTVVLTKYGYFAALLKREEMSDFLEDVFITKNPNAFGSGRQHKGESIIDSDYLIWDGGYTKVTVAGSSYDPNTTLTTTVLSNGRGYDFLQYGQWEHSGFFTGSPTYRFVNYAWWLEGYAPPADIIAQQKGSISYSGEAYGTMYIGVLDAVHQLSGDFSAMANFDSASIQDFYLHATDPVNPDFGAIISGGAHGAIQPDGTFEITGGDWHLHVPGHSLDPSSKGAHGRFFGPSVEEIGGDWGMVYEPIGTSPPYSYPVGASGVWAGKKNK